MNSTEWHRRVNNIRIALQQVQYIANPSSTFLLDNEGSIISSGTGTLLKIADRIFIITAAHVIRNRPIQTIRLYIFRMRDFIPFRVLDWEVDDRTDVDVAYIEIDRDEFALFCHDDPYDPPREIYRKPIDCSKIARQIATNRGTFVFGYPASWRDYIITAEQASTGYPLVSPLVHFSTVIFATQNLLHLEYAPEEQHWDGNGNPITAPDPGGMSGGGVWQFWRTGVTIAGQEVQELRLSGTITRFRDLERDYITATPIHHTINLIIDRHPELEAEINRTLPQIREM